MKTVRTHIPVRATAGEVVEQLAALPPGMQLIEVDQHGADSTLVALTFAHPHSPEPRLEEPA